MSNEFRDADSRVRQRAIVAAARAGDGSVLPELERLAQCDPSQAVRREAASAIGRLARRHPLAFAMLVGLSQHDDPGVLTQAARGLVSATTDAQQAIAQPILRQLAQHPNEVLSDFVQSEITRSASKSNVRPISGGGGVREKIPRGCGTG
ncbi:MAG: HEAT repeat domain-containing protein [Chloroflexi bacterium]|nr:HEAT repeat domain-containing protein [Chloroflexota bacterium]